MEFVYGYIRNISIFMIVTTLILNIFPEKSSKKYIKLFAGFLLLMLIFNPILKYKKNNINVDKIISEYSHVKIDKNSNLENSVNKFREDLFERISEKYEDESEKNNGN